MTLSLSLPAAATQALSALIAEITGAAPRDQPWTAPAMLFSDPAVKAALPVPEAAHGQVLVHDYQRIDRSGPLPPDSPLRATARATDGASGTEYTFVLEAGSVAVTLTTALRLYDVAQVAGAAAAPFRAAMLAEAAETAPVTVSRSQTDRYLALSGDENPIHRDPEAAAALGFAAPIVPGMLLLALIQPLAEPVLDGTLSRLTCRFMAPLEVGAACRIAVVPRGAGRARAVLYGAERDRMLAVADLQAA
ncbi:MaoC family dehydratase [Psychromarinibacter sp. C21-152]|uniref:MaoC family dehydratase n=1 Tax=Psychromarinibacter sediminicola TaxID=3033385 RepID=A0AAE3NQC0_9RHOB|nr:MaoC family dehydratase [Psychromarinibacter sediminicola]MDF0601588.1 MaoC family dehydratase [Psychromarinibacter sediminicola]